MAITVTGLTKEMYIPSEMEYKKILDDISVHIRFGELTAIIGKIGSGKSTFIRYLNGLSKPTNGTISVGNKVFGFRSREWLQQVGVVLQFSQQQLFLPTVREELVYAAKNFGIDLDVNLLCQKIGLDESLLEQDPHLLSGGQMRKVAIGSVLSANPRILILDEPFAGLDWSAQFELTQLLQQLVSSGIAVVIVTHDLSFVWEYCQRVLVFEQGRIIVDTDSRSWIESSKHGNEETIGYSRFFSQLNEKKINVDSVRKWLEEQEERN
ncbi:MAG: ABC transporter ATP-binding protein [Culicoidibacterales bacterium]